MSEGLHMPDALGRKVGPLPVAGWAAAVLGGLGIAWYMRRSGTGTAAHAPDASQGDGASTDTLAPPTGLGGAAVSDPSQPGGTTPPTDPETAGQSGTAVPITTNGQWRQQAVKYLIGHRVAPINAEAAIARYLSGKALSPVDARLVNSALAGIGPTPQPVPPIVLTPAAKPKPKPKAKPKHSPVAHHTQPTAHHHAKRETHPNARRDTGTNTNPGR